MKSSWPTFWQRLGFCLYDTITGYRILEQYKSLNSSQWLTSDEQYSLQLKKLQSLLQYSYQYIPYYRRIFNEVDFHPRNLIKRPESFQRIPPLSKAYIREHKDEFISGDPARRRYALPGATSGSTGEPLIFREDQYFREFFIASALRHHTWSGWQLGQPRLYLWGTIPGCRQIFKDRAHTYLKNFAWNRSFVKAYELSPEKMNLLANRIRKGKSFLIQAYPASLYFFSQFVREQGWNDIEFKAVYTSGEKLFPYQREHFKETFKCEVFNKYAALELGEIACECELHKGLHINTEGNFIEILNQDDVPVEDGTPGYITATCLTNYTFPFIRYRLEDLGRMSRQHCPCGRGQPMLEVIEGRSGDVFKTKKGKMVWGECLDIFAIKGVKQWQIIQKSLDLILIRLVVTDTFQKNQLSGIENKLMKVMGEDIRVEFEFPSLIPVEPGKKYRSAISEI